MPGYTNGNFFYFSILLLGNHDDFNIKGKAVCLAKRKDGLCALTAKGLKTALRVAESESG